MQTENEILTPLQRWLEVLIIVGMILLLVFLAYHQIEETGFFTGEFGNLEKVALYTPIIFGLIAPALRASTGHRNRARPYEATTSLVLAVGSLWLLNVFPFDYTHLADALPAGLRFSLEWVTDDIGKLLLVLQVIIGPITAILTTLKFLTYVNRPSETYSERHAV